MSKTHTAIAAIALGQMDAIQVPTEKPLAGEVLIKVEYASMVAFDTYITDLGFYVEKHPALLGANAAGVVAELGEGVDDLKVGDRVTTFAYQSPKARGMQEYSVQPRTTCAKIPDDVSLDAAATIPDNFITAFYTLFNQLGLPVPSSFPPSTPPELATSPILIYGAGSTTGQYAIQLLHAAGYMNIIMTASRKHHEYLRSLGATHTFDYSSSTLTEDIAKAAGGDGKVNLAVDCITAEATLAAIAKVISPSGTVGILLPIKEGSNVRGEEGTQMHMEIQEDKNPFSKGTNIVGVRTFNYQEDQYLKTNLMPKILPSLLASGIIKPNRVRLLDQGTFKERVAVGLDLLRNNKVSGEKVVVKVTA